MSRTRTVLLPSLAALMVTSLGCEPYRIEYHRRPTYHREAAVGELRDREVLPDGTVLVYREVDPRAERAKRQAERGGEGRRFEMREELDDGTIVLRALLPEHIIVNFLTCLQNEEYDLIYEQLLSQHTRREWEERGRTEEDFVDYFAQNRGHMMRTLTRLYMGLSNHETLMEQHDMGVVELRLRQHAARGLRFTRIRIIPEGPGLKLINIR